MKKKLPIVNKPVPASSQRELAVKPVQTGSRPEFPTRNELYRKAGLLGGATLLASGLANAEPPAKPMPPTPKPVETGSIEDGSINGKPLAKAAPKVRVYREGGGIGPSEDMWNVDEVQSFISWTMAKEGRLAIQTKYKLDYDGVKITLDGFDANRNIGYAYIDPHDPERAQFTPAVRAKLDEWMKGQKLAIMFVEVKRYPDPAALKGKVIKFLHAVQKAPPTAGKIPTQAAPPPPTKK
jgi:hypothetical protein